MPVTVRWKRAALLALLLGLLGLVGWGVAGQVQAWRHYRAGARALERDDPDAARRHLQACVRVWSNSAEAHFLLARAARRSGELVEARRHLEEAGRLGWVEEALGLERALLAVQDGSPGGALAYLEACLKADHPDATLILEVLTVHYLNNFQLREAGACVKRWLELQPERALAWHSQAVLATRLRNTDGAILAYAEEVRLAPERHGSRFELVKLLLERQRPDEAAGHLAVLTEALPNDLDVRTELARLREREGKRDEAARLLDSVLARRPNNPAALHLRGRVALAAKRPKEAERYLSQAVRLDPASKDLHYTWATCLERVGKPEEAAKARERLKKIEAELKRVGELAKSVAARPGEPGPRREIGVIYIRNGMDEQGLAWLMTSLNADPNDPLTHRALADYYERKGKRRLASAHRARAGGEVPAGP